MSVSLLYLEIFASRTSKVLIYTAIAVITVTMLLSVIVRIPLLFQKFQQISGD